MSGTRRIRRTAVLAALACFLLGASAGPAAAALPNDAAPTAAALQQERYYSSYGEPEPITASATPAPADDRPWLEIALAVGLALGAASVLALRRHQLTVRRRAHATT